MSTHKTEFLLGVLGCPVAHSRSPAMHNAALQAKGIEGFYGRFEVAAESLTEAMRGIRALGIHGVNVTVPHKETVRLLLDEVDAIATRIGAVNTIFRDKDRLVGTNTDARGLVRALERAEVAIEGARVVVLGAGGAARAAAVGLTEAGAARVQIAARRPEQAQALLQDYQSLSAIDTTPVSLLDLNSCMAHCDLLVQATSAPLQGPKEAAAFADALPLDHLPQAAVVIDLVYEPLETQVLAAARRLGLKTVDGLGMLLYQGAIAFETWFGGEGAPVEIMRAALQRV